MKRRADVWHGRGRKQKRRNTTMNERAIIAPGKSKKQKRKIRAKSISIIPETSMREIIKYCFANGMWQISVVNKHTYALAKNYLPYPFLTNTNDVKKYDFWTMERPNGDAYNDPAAKNKLYYDRRIKIRKDPFLSKRWIIYYALCEAKFMAELKYGNEKYEYDLVEYILFNENHDDSVMRGLIHNDTTFHIAEKLINNAIDEIFRHAARFDHWQLVELLCNNPIFSKSINLELLRGVFIGSKKDENTNVMTVILQTEKLEIMSLLKN